MEMEMELFGEGNFSLGMFEEPLLPNCSLCHNINTSNCYHTGALQTMPFTSNTVNLFLLRLFN
jgi:hypothetical protein